MSRIFAFANLATGNIESVLDVGLMATNYQNGQIQGDHIMLDVTDRDDRHLLITERAYKDGEWILRPPQPNIYYDWNNEQEIWILSNRLLEEVRAKRNKMLNSSDWTQMADSPLTDDEKITWAIYRQALRDITAHLDGVTDMADVPWPTME